MRALKVIISCIICVGLLGGVGYGIYTAIVNQGSEVSIFVDGEFFDINDIIKDYDRIAEGTTIVLPSTDEDLATFGISKEGYSFGGWYYDAGYTRLVENSSFVKSKGLINLYLQWKPKDYTIYTIELKDVYAEDFDFKNFGNIDYYKQIANIQNQDDFAPNIISYKSSIMLPAKSSAQRGYEYVWIKWIGESEYEKDESDMPIYYSGGYQVTSDAVFVQCKMPKKYTVTYKYIDEMGVEQIIGQTQLRFNEETDNIYQEITELNYARVGYDFKEFYLQVGENKISIDSSAYINEYILSAVGDTGKFDCYVAYTPKKYEIRIVGYADGNPIYTDGNLEINIAENIDYYSNLQTYLTDKYQNTTLLVRNFLIFQNFTLENGEVITEETTMPAYNIEVRANYSIKSYVVDIQLSLKDETVSLNAGEQEEYRYGTAFDIDNDMRDFTYALNQGINTKSYFTDEFVFASYTVSREGESDIEGIIDIDGLKGLACLQQMDKDVVITINTTKSRFFVAYTEYSLADDKVVKVYERHEIFFDDMTGVGSVQVAGTPIKANNELGGWKLVDTATFGDYAYIDYGYTIYKSQVTDDVIAYAEWYDTDMSGDFSRYWNYVLNDENKTATITSYNGSKVNIAIPKSIQVSGELYTITSVGDGTKSVLSTTSSVKKIIIPTSVILVSRNAFAGANKVDVRFKDSDIDERNLVISSFAFTSFFDSKGSSLYGVKSVYLPKRTLEVQEGAFAYNSYLENIDINSENGTYTTFNDVENGVNVLYKNNGIDRELVVYSARNRVADFTIPSDVSRICSYAFSYSEKWQDAPSLRNVRIESYNHLKEIGDYAFANQMTLNSVYFPELNNLTTLGEGIFDKAFSISNVQNKYDIAFKYVAFDFNHLNKIPAKMFNNNIFLLSIDMRNADMITEVGASAFHQCGQKYVEESSNQNDNFINYYSSSYTNIHNDGLAYLENNFGVVWNNEPDSVFKQLLLEYTQAFVLADNQLSKVAESAFRTTVVNVYLANNNSISIDTQLKIHAFYGTTFRALNSMQYNTSYQSVASPNVVMEIDSIIIEMYSFHKSVLIDMGIRFIDCIFLVGSSGGQSFKDFKIIDTTNTPGTYNFEVIINNQIDAEIDGSNVSSTTIKSGVFAYMSMPNSNVSLIVKSGLNATLGAQSMYRINCNELNITNIMNVANNTFADAEENSMQTSAFDSAKKITFTDCSFDIEVQIISGTETINKFRNLLFYEMRSLKTVVFNNCTNIYNRFSTDENYKNNFNTFKTLYCPYVDVASDDVFKTITVNFRENTI